MPLQEGHHDVLWCLLGTQHSPPGFPNGGLSQTFDGRSFSWGDGPVVAVGRTYDLCGGRQACEGRGLGRQRSSRLVQSI